MDDLPFSRILDLGAEIENERSGYVKFRLSGGMNLISRRFRLRKRIQLADPRPPKPFVDHFGIDLRREMGIVRALFEDTPGLAKRAGWPCKIPGRHGEARFLLSLNGRGEESGFIHGRKDLAGHGRSIRPDGPLRSAWK